MRQKANTLLEILVVIVFIGILAAVSIPRLSLSFVTKMKLRTAGQRLVADLRYTRRLAVTNNEDYRLSVDASAKEYSLYDSGDTQYSTTRTVDSAITINADKDFIFGPLGNADSSSDTSVSLSAGSTQYDISVTVATGRVSMSEH
ncbi:MAG: GspH/FimT family pseudopilin [Candidatus Omnitrophota bacterium]